MPWYMGHASDLKTTPWIALCMIERLADKAAAERARARCESGESAFEEARDNLAYVALYYTWTGAGLPAHLWRKAATPPALKARMRAAAEAAAASFLTTVPAVAVDGTALVPQPPLSQTLEQRLRRVDPSLGDALLQCMPEIAQAEREREQAERERA